jgi:CRP/FNR family transcriptional regulator, anaerobic regulatory protein
VPVPLPSIRAIPMTANGPTLRLTMRDREHLATIATLLRVGPGTVFYERGTEAGWVYNIVSGTVCSYRPMPDGAQRVAAFLFAEDLFGLAQRGVYVNSTRAVTPVSAFKLPLDALSGLLMGNAQLQFRFLCKITHTLREAQRRALLLTRRDPVERVAVFLAMMDEAQGDKRPNDLTISLPMQHADIGSYLNMTPGSVDAALGALGDRGIIVRQGDSVRVLDRAAFTAVCED